MCGTDTRAELPLCPGAVPLQLLLERRPDAEAGSVDGMEFVIVERVVGGVSSLTVAGTASDAVRDAVTGSGYRFTTNN